MAGLKARGLKGGKGNGESNVDWKAIHDQVEEGTVGGRISVMIDLGLHKEDMAMGSKGFTGFLTEEDAEAWLEEMKKKYGKKNKALNEASIEEADDSDYDASKTKVLELEDDGTWSVVEEDAEFVVTCNEFGGEREYQELAIFADLTENPVDYGGDIGTKAFRVMINRRWMGDIKGFQLKKSAPTTKDGVWNVKGNTKLAELATATGCKHLLEVDLEDADWSEMLGQGLNIGIEKSGDDLQYLEVGTCVGLKKRKGQLEEVDELEQDPILITFDDCTVEDLEAAHIRSDVIKKIKSATDYAGSQIEKAIKEYEKRLKAKLAAKKEAAEGDDEDGDADEDEKPNRKVNRVSKKTETKSKSENEDDEDEVDGEDEAVEEKTTRTRKSSKTKTETESGKDEEEEWED